MTLAEKSFYNYLAGKFIKKIIHYNYIFSVIQLGLIAAYQIYLCLPKLLIPRLNKNFQERIRKELEIERKIRE